METQLCSGNGMRNLMKMTSKSLSHHVKSVFNSELNLTSFPLSNNSKTYDYTTPIAIRLFNEFKYNSKSPLEENPNDSQSTNSKEFEYISSGEVAQSLIDQFSSDEKDIIERLDVTDKGMIGISIKNQVIEKEINRILFEGLSVDAENKKKQRIAVDFSSPNIAKELHVGHLRSTIAGESICRIFEFYSHDVLRINHVGDWGTKFGTIIQCIKEDYPKYLEELPSLRAMDDLYKQAKKKWDISHEFAQRSRSNVVALQKGDPEMRKAWEMMCKLTRDELKGLYKRLSISLEECGESFYNPMLPEVVQELEAKKIVKLDNGAKVIFIPGYTVPLIVQKSDGAYGYDSTDVAASKYRLQHLKCDRVIYITDSGQSLHFNLLFEAAKLAGWYDPSKARMDHIGVGVVRGTDGKKFSTSKAGALKLQDLLEESRVFAEEILTKRLASAEEEGRTLEYTREDIGEIAEKISIASIRYYDMRKNRISTYHFNFKHMLEWKGNTAVFLLYNYARICSLFRKCGVTREKLIQFAKTSPFKLSHIAERRLALALLKFPSVLENVADKLHIHLLCDLLYEIACKFSHFYKVRSVLTEECNNPKTLELLVLCEVTRMIMEKCFYLLGMQPIEKMQEAKSLLKKSSEGK